MKRLVRPQSLLTLLRSPIRSAPLAILAIAACGGQLDESPETLSSIEQPMRPEQPPSARASSASSKHDLAKQQRKDSLHGRRELRREQRKSVDDLIDFVERHSREMAELRSNLLNAIARADRGFRRQLEDKIYAVMGKAIAKVHTYAIDNSDKYKTMRKAIEIFAWEARDLDATLSQPAPPYSPALNWREKLDRLDGWLDSFGALGTPPRAVVHEEVNEGDLFSIEFATPVPTSSWRVVKVVPRLGNVEESISSPPGNHPVLTWDTRGKSGKYWIRVVREADAQPDLTLETLDFFLTVKPRGDH